MVDITVAGLEKRFGPLALFTGLDLHLRDRDYVCLLGPSGCGKSTLMRMIAGLDHPDGGDLLFDDSRINDLPCSERDVGLAFQNYALYPHLSVDGNLRFPLRAPVRRREYSDADIDRRVADIAALLKIEPLLHRSINQLSGGQQQRVALGRTLIRHPRVLLLDEPVTHLDARLRYEMRAELKRLHQSMGTTSIHVTHDQQEALAMADTLVVMKDGGIEQVGPPLELYNRPATAFVAGFLGHPPRSVVEATLVGRDDGRDVEIGGVPHRLPDALAAVAARCSGRDVLLALRADAIVPDAGAGPRLDATVRAHEMVENTQLIVFEVDGQRFNYQTRQPRDVHTGVHVPITIELDRALLFDGATGRTLH